MIRQLVGEELEAVTFVRDHVQLQFLRHLLKCLTWPLVDAVGQPLAFGDRGYRDALCGLIDHRVTAVRDDDESGLVLEFGGRSLRIRPRQEEVVASGEIAVLMTDGDCAVWRAGEGSFAHLA